ncbi:MAG TPA: hypothetical protein VFI65_10755 [Streptosporangiaceae bacterium]|nr:hypothetical protein [Streptosporangiaceae bacterium]
MAAGSLLAAGPATATVSAPQKVGASGTVDSVVCTSAGNCTAIGDLGPSSPKVLFSVSEKNGVWGSARAIPGITALLGHHNPFGSQVRDLSCSSAGNCGAGGFYAPNASNVQALVVSEKNGTWGKAQAVRGLAALNVGRNAEVDSIACPVKGNCSAGGSYAIKTKNILADSEVFVVNEKNGVWGKAEEIPGTAKLNTGTNAAVEQIVCPSAGNCIGVGYYTAHKASDAFSVIEKKGTWGKAQAISSVPVGEHVAITKISCQTVRDCTGVGNFSTKTPGQFGVFAINEHNGTWGSFTPIPGMSALPGGGSIEQGFDSLTCPSPGDCTAAGDYNGKSDPGFQQPFVVTETNGVWGNAQTLPGFTALTSSFGGSLGGLVCKSVGNCSAAGHFFAKVGDGVFVSTETNGVWGNAAALPGLRALDVGRDASIPRLACGGPGDCSLGGFYGVHSPHGQQVIKPYLAVQKNGTWGKAKEVSGVEP